MSPVPSHPVRPGGLKVETPFAPRLCRDLTSRLFLARRALNPDTGKRRLDVRKGAGRTRLSGYPPINQ